MTRDYLDLQLTFSEAIASKVACSSAQAVLKYTNFFRRFGLGNPTKASSSIFWQRYSNKLDTLSSYDEKLAWTLYMSENAPVEQLPTSQKPFGYFSLELSNEGKRVRSHFYSIDHGEVSPLHESQLNQRKQDLKNLFTHVKHYYPNAEEVVGASWLYNTQVYQNLFPPAFIESKRVLTGMTSFQGMSSWGQFLTYKGDVKANLKEQLLKNLETIDPDRLWELFPLPTFLLNAPIQTFYDHFGILD